MIIYFDFVDIILIMNIYSNFDDLILIMLIYSNFLELIQIMIIYSDFVNLILIMIIYSNFDDLILIMLIYSNFVDLILIMLIFYFCGFNSNYAHLFQFCGINSNYDYYEEPVFLTNFKVYIIISFVIQYCVPTLLLTYSYVRMGIRLWTNQTPGNADNRRDEGILENKKKFIKMMAVIVGAFGICWLPWHFFHVVGMIYPTVMRYEYDDM